MYKTIPKKAFLVDVCFIIRVIANLPEGKVIDDIEEEIIDKVTEELQVNSDYSIGDSITQITEDKFLL